MDSSKFLRLNLPELKDPADIRKLTENFGWLDDFCRQINDLHKTINTRLDKLETSSEFYATGLESVRSEVNSLGRDIQALAAKHDSDVATIDRRITGIESNISTIGRQIAELDARVSKLEKTSPAIKIISFKASPMLVLQGTSANINFIWELNSPASSIRINGESVSGTSYTMNNVTSARTFTLVVADADGNTDTASVYVDFLNAIVYGSSGDAVPTSATLSALGTKVVSEEISRTISVSTGNGNYIYYAYPRRLGTVRFFTYGMFEGGFKDPQTVTFTNSAGYAEEYYVYRSANKLTGNTEIQIVKEV